MNGTSLMAPRGDGDVDMEDGHSLPPGSNYYADAGEEHITDDSEDEDEIYYVPETLPQIEWGAYCSARQEVEKYCKEYVESYKYRNPGVRATFEEMLMTEMPTIIDNFCHQNPYPTEYKMVFFDYAKYIWKTHRINLQARTLLIYMGRYQDYYDDPAGNGDHYDQTYHQNLEDMFDDMRVHSRLPTVTPRSRTVRDVVGRVATSRKTKCAGGDCAGPQKSSARS